MGRSNQHDFKITIVKLLLLFSCTLFCSCNYLTYKKIEIDSEYTGSKAANLLIKREGPVYLGVWNNSDEVVSTQKAPKIKKIKERSCMGKLSCEEYSAFNDYKNFNYLKNKLSQNKKSNKSVRFAEIEVIDNTAQIGDKKTFYMWRRYKQYGNIVEDFFPKGMFCKAVGEHCILWKSNDDDIILKDSDYTALAQKFDSIYVEETKLVGSNIYTKKIDPTMINPQKKIDIVIDDLLEDKSLENTIIGYQRSADCFINTKEIYNEDTHEIEPDTSNEAQVIYIDSLFLEKSPELIYSTLIHEFNHLLNFCVKQNAIYSNPEQYVFFTEMLAMMVEDSFQEFLGLENKYSPKSRLSEYISLGNTCFSPMSSFDINNSDISAYYASTYALAAYLTRNYGGLDLIHELATNNFVGEISIQNALLKLGYVSEKGKLSDYEKIIKEMPYILINVQKRENEDLEKINKPGQDAYRTLNRSWLSDDFTNLSLTEIVFKNIEYSDCYKLPDVEIGKNGYLLCYLGEDLKNVIIDVPDEGELEYFVYFPE